MIIHKLVTRPTSITSLTAYFKQNLLLVPVYQSLHANRHCGFQFGGEGVAF